MRYQPATATRLVAWSIALCACMALAACRVGRTELVVVVDTDLEAGPHGLIRMLRLSVRSDGPDGGIERAPVRFIPLGDGTNGTASVPWSFGVIPLNGNDSDSGRVSIEIAGCGDDRCTGPNGEDTTIVVSRAQVGFVRHEVRELHMRLSRACAWVDCGNPARTCDPDARYCVSASIDPNTLPLRDAGVDASVRNVQLVAGGGTSCIRRSDGSVVCWGGGNATYGFQHFPGVSSEQARGAAVAGLERAADVSVTSTHGCAVADGHVRCWGSNAHAQLGDGTLEPREGVVDSLGPSDVVQVSTGAFATCARTASRDVWCWGERLVSAAALAGWTEPISTPYRVDDFAGAIDVAVGREFRCAVMSDFTLRCLGEGVLGALGDGMVMNRANATAVTGLPPVVDVGATFSYACARTRDGEVWCWGENAWGNAGNGTRAITQPTPVRVEGLTAPVAQLAVGRSHACARTREGAVECWGRNDSGQLGDGTHIDRSRAVSVIDVAGSMSPLHDVSDIAAGSDHTCAQLRNGEVRCWGSDSSEQLASQRAVVHPSPTVVPEFSVLACASARNSRCLDSFGGRTCALGDSGAACWGLEGLGARITPEFWGDAHRDTNSRPVATPPLPSGVVDVQAGLRHSCALLVDGHVYCWGSNELGQLGNATREDSQTPVPVSGIEHATHLAVGLFHSCAILADTTVACWGLNPEGRAGQLPTDQCGTTGCNLTPAVVTGVRDAVDLSVGELHACAVLSSGDVWCWGSPYNGVRGSFSVYPFIATAVVGVHDATRVAAGPASTCVVTVDGGVRCWGDNSYGELGAGHAVAVGACGGGVECSLAPVDVVGLPASPVTEVRIGLDHACARTDDGHAYCWGASDFNECGSADPSPSNPVPVTTCQRGRCARRAVLVTPRDHVRGVAAGGFHSCAFRDDGTVWCWGDVSQGQFDLGDPTARLIATEWPTPIEPLTDIVRLSSTYLHTCALDRQGRSFCWGDSFGGQLGEGSPGNPRVPQIADDVNDAIMVRASQSHTCALSSDGSVRCWGANFFAQLGSGTTRMTSRANIVAGLGRATSIAAAASSSCALLETGEVACWGSNALGQSGIDPPGPDPVAPTIVAGVADVVQLESTLHHACALQRSGRVSCWGRNDDGQLGDGSTTQRGRPLEVRNITDAIQVAVGDVHSCALRADGTVACWGDNRLGQLGSGTNRSALVPVVVAGLSDAVELRAHGYSTCARTRAGELVCWGANPRQIIAPGLSPQYQPTMVSAVATGQITSFAIGDESICVRTTDDRVQCWGRTFEAELGIPVSFGERAAPVEAVGLRDVRDVSVGRYHACATTADGHVYCWGQNANGQLGHPRGVAHPIPIRVESLAGTRSIATGSAHACTLLDDGHVRCWGENTHGQLGLGDILAHDGTNEVPLLRDVTQVAAGADHTCALLGTGAVRCWGRSERAQTGIRAMAFPDVRTVTLPPAQSIAAGSHHTCAITAADGSVLCWGDGSSGQLGFDAPEECVGICNTRDACPRFACSTAPRQVVGLPAGVRASAVTAGGAHSCTLLIDGTVWCWGSNARGQLGDGTRESRARAVLVGSVRGARSVAAGRDHRCDSELPIFPDCNPSGEDHTCAIDSDRHVWCWGRNDYGEIGDGTTEDRLTPTLVVGGETIDEISLGGTHTCARNDRGGVMCWGDDSWGQLAIGSEATRPYPGLANIPR